MFVTEKLSEDAILEQDVKLLVHTKRIQELVTLFILFNFVLCVILFLARPIINF